MEHFSGMKKGFRNEKVVVSNRSPSWQRGHLKLKTL
jgi:hypothetical protein